jgi:hypothetical protein
VNREITEATNHGTPETINEEFQRNSQSRSIVMPYKSSNISVNVRKVRAFQGPAMVVLSTNR